MGLADIQARVAAAATKAGRAGDSIDVIAVSKKQPLDRVEAVLEAMQEAGVPLLLHGEVTDPGVDVFDREAVFIERILAPLLQRLPRLKVVLEHITTRQAAEFVAAAPANVGATITAHHLLYNRNAMFHGGIRPHYYCLPVLKRETHREALVAAATSGFAVQPDAPSGDARDCDSAGGAASSTSSSNGNRGRGRNTEFFLKLFDQLREFQNGHI